MICLRGSRNETLPLKRLCHVSPPQNHLGAPGANAFDMTTQTARNFTEIHSGPTQRRALQRRPPRQSPNMYFQPPTNDRKQTEGWGGKTRLSPRVGASTPSREDPQDAADLVVGWVETKVKKTPRCRSDHQEHCWLGAQCGRFPDGVPGGALLEVWAAAQGGR